LELKVFAEKRVMVLNETVSGPSKIGGGQSPTGTLEPDDIALVKRCQAGDSHAFDELVTRYRSKVYAMIYGMVQNEQDAWDLAQEGFVKAWRSIHRFKGQSTFYTWLYRIMTNAAIDWLRRKGVKGDAEFDDQVALTHLDPNSKTTPKIALPPNQSLEQNEIQQRIDAAMTKLSPEHRAVVVMKEMQDLQYHEIADILGCSIGTVMSRLFYARKKLQTLLKDVYENL
jgi:RNA polymerase sigma-70 factor, ECF subfamily